jgi:hypothetical protein
MNEYPKAMYRPGSEFEWEGMSLDMRVVEDAQAVTEAQNEGWYLMADLLAANEAANEPDRKTKKAADTKPDA